MENWKNLMHAYSNNVFVTIFLSNFASLLVNPTIADVTMEVVCLGKDECSLSIYLSGFQQAIAGLASVFMMPLIGNLSDTYDRKLLLTIPLTLAIIPFVILGTKRTTEFFYVYYVVKTLTSTLTDGGTICLALSYMADNVSEGKRVSAFGIFSSVVSAAMVCGTLTARILPTDRIYQVAAVVAIVAAVYMRIFLEDDRRMAHLPNDGVEQPMLKSTTEEERNESLKTTDLMKLPKDMYRLFKTSNTVSLASFVAFFNSLAEAGIAAFLMYFLKARFHFQKDQFADIWLITYAAATFSTLTPSVGSLLQMLLDSIAWAPWVPYASAFFGIFLFLPSPSIRCIISRKVRAHDQSLMRNCSSGMSSLANVVSPLIFSPLSALFLSGDAPFTFPGFSILSVGLAYVRFLRFSS
ncbi:tetracycline resistance protein, class G-like [Salvia splendens]|uniref:tetracycline resistance protein, class G-like n=1 Tax=Salvia splendens TaxID=180675 RepID=UPI001C263A25|nr:tetracycline resistance protein, class G-like [Salvia splendens]